jgi:hypothetical protein
MKVETDNECMELKNIRKSDYIGIPLFLYTLYVP